MSGWMNSSVWFSLAMTLSASWSDRIGWWIVGIWLFCVRISRFRSIKCPKTDKRVHNEKLSTTESEGVLTLGFKSETILSFYFRTCVFLNLGRNRLTTSRSIMEQGAVKNKLKHRASEKM